MKHFKTLYLITITFLFLHGNLFAQENLGKISGHVFSTDTKNPIAFLTVFIANSTIGTTTDEQGYFVIDELRPGSYELVFRHLSYDISKEKIILSDNEELNIEVKLDIKTINIEEIVKSPDYLRRRKDFRTFKRLFLGGISNMTIKLLNPEDLFFYYNPEKNELTAFAKGPINIVNKMLGYKITYYLDFFRYYEKEAYYTFSGSAYYEDLKPGIFIQEINWRKNREACYRGSLMEFLRSLYDSTYINKGYAVGGVLNIKDSPDSVDTALFDEIKSMNNPDSLSSLYKIVQKQNNVIRYFPNLKYDKFVSQQEGSNEKRLAFMQTLNISFGLNFSRNYLNDMSSSLTLNEDYIMFDGNGNIFPPLGLVSHGYFASKRNLRYMLPIDYYPPVKN